MTSPAVPHFAVDSDSTASHMPSHLPMCQARCFANCARLGSYHRQTFGRMRSRRLRAECKSRLIFEVQQRITVPLQPVEKRRLAVNFMQDLLHSYPGRNTVKR